jgi:hypothetical protein
MKAMVWTCDRCGSSVEVPREVVIEQPWGLAAEAEPYHWRKPPVGWTVQVNSNMAGDLLEDVGDGCLTAEERAGQVLEAAELTVLGDLLAAGGDDE